MLLNCDVRENSWVPWSARRSNQSTLKEISPEFSLEGLMLKLKLQNFDHLMWRTNSLEKTLILAKIEGRRRRGQQRMRWLDGITNVMGMSLSRLWVLVIGSLVCYSPWGCKVLDTTELNWTELNWIQEMEETQVWYLGWEDPLEEGMATRSSILTWRIPRTEELGRL